MTDRADDGLAEQAAAVLRGMAEHGIRIDDRAFERFTTTLLAEYDRRGAEIERLQTRFGIAMRLLGERRRKLEQLRQQRRAALALHQDAGGSQGYGPDGGYTDLPRCCGSCGTLGEYGEPWPCPTARALGAADEPTTGGAE